MISNLSESLAKPPVMAKLNMAYLSRLKKPAKLLSSSLPVSSSWVLCTPRTSLYYLVPKHLRVMWPWFKQSHLLSKACSPNGTDNRRRRQRRTKRPPPKNPATFLRDFTIYMTTKDATIWKRCLNYTACLTVQIRMFLFWERLILTQNAKNRQKCRLLTVNISFATKRKQQRKKPREIKSPEK